MQLAEKYARILENAKNAQSHLRDEDAREPLCAARKLPEVEIQARWFAGEFGRDFRATNGEALRVVQFGIWNREAGPDFAEAAISINGGEPMRGSIELDIDARDWERHGHATNDDYESVALHVFVVRGDSAFFTRTARNRNVPQLQLDLRALLKSDPPNPQPLAKPGRCVAPLRELSTEKTIEVLDAAAQFRLQKKAARIARLRELHGSDEALFQALAETLGYKSNKLPFALLAQRLPIRFLLQRTSEIDALLFGVSGFLPSIDLAKFDPQTRGYLQKIWEKWWSLRADFERLEIRADLWRMSGHRPANHPQRRVAALARIAENWPKIRALSASCDARAIRNFFTLLGDAHWDFHFTLTSKKSSARMALVGASRVAEMLVNVFFPLAILDDAAHWEKLRKLHAPLGNKRADIAAMRLFGDDETRTRELLKLAVRQQGLLQIYEDFCMRDNSDCANCPFPKQLQQWR